MTINDAWEPEFASGPVPPAGYVPLEMPELWEPPAETGPPAAPDPVAVTAPPMVPSIGDVVSAPVDPPVTAVPRARAPRSFAELKTGPLAEREFADLTQLAVAAVREAGWDPAAIAPLFRVPAWRVHAWVDAAAAAPAPAPNRTWRPGQTR